MGKDRILVVDDDPDNRAMIGHFLANWGYEVDDAKNGKIALEKVHAHPPSLVLLDLEMPEMDGFETCERLKTDPETEWIPVIIFTGLEKMPHRVRGFQHGADDYVVKTVEPDELRTRINLVLKRTKRYASLAGSGSAVAPETIEIPEASEPSASAPKTKDEPPQKDLAVSVSLSRIPFPDAMRLVLAHGKNGVVRTVDQGNVGTVYIREGAIVHADANGDQGDEAFYELALWKQGRFDFQDREPGPGSSITTPTRSLLVEANRRLDAWSVISAKVPSFDLIPKWVPLSGAESIRLTKSDWAIIRLVDDRRSIREIVDLLRTDIFEAGRVIYSLLTIGVLRLDQTPASRDEAFELVPQRGDAAPASEPFELTAAEWILLSHVDGQRSLGMIRELMSVPPAPFMKMVRALKASGFIRLTSRERRRKGA
jgi:DNA-binding response OmpR family regulator